MSTDDLCEPRFNDGVEYVCFRVLAKLERNRGKDPLRYQSPDGTVGFLCSPCLVEMLNARARSQNGKVD
jgi:hypothetical protein